jgi:hypothetical protein
MRETRRRVGLVVSSLRHVRRPETVEPPAACMSSHLRHVIQRGEAEAEGVHKAVLATARRMPGKDGEGGAGGLVCAACAAS